MTPRPFDTPRQGEPSRPPRVRDFADVMKVLLADDHRLMLDGIRRALEEDGGFEIVGETQNGAQVLPLVGQTGPDLVVLDVRMPNMDGLQCLEEIRRRHPKIKVVMLSASTTPDLIEEALRRGASAYVLKTVDPSDLALHATPGDRRHRLLRRSASGELDAERREGRRPHRPRDRDPHRARAAASRTTRSRRSCGSRSRR